MRKLAWAVVLAIALVSSFLACGSAGKKEKDPVLAVVDGDQITESMFRQEAENLPPYIRPIVETRAGRKQFLDSLVTRDLLMREALRRGVEKRVEVRERIEQARRSILLETLLRDVAEDSPPPSDEAVRKYYEENREAFREGERVRVRHILFRSEKKAEEAAALARKGVPFEELMKDAEDAGGSAADLGLIERGAYDKQFEDAAFEAPENSILGPVKTVYGYHVIQVMEKRPAGLPPFEEVQGRIDAEMREAAQREAFENLVNGLRNRADIRMEGIPPAAEDPSAAPPGDQEAPASTGNVPGGER